MLLEVKNLSVAYGELLALHDVDIEIAEGELVVVLGANGAGKSTLMRSIIGWLSPREGSIRFNGENLIGMPPWKRFRNGLSLVPEGGRLFGDMTVKENFSVTDASNEGVLRALELFPVLKERMDQQSSTLSGGERQMLALGRAIATQPQLLLVDEASTGLMPTLVEQLFEVLQDLRDGGLPILLVEQNTQALELADRGYVMEAGEIAQQGAADELADDPELQRAYLGL